MFSRQKKIDSGNSPRRQVADRSSHNSKSSFFSYHASRQETQSELRQRPGQLVNKKYINWQLLPIYIAGGAVIVCLLYITTLSSGVRVQHVRSASLLRDPTVYQEAANKLLDSSIWNKNKLTIDTSSFETKMRQQFPELSRAALTLPLMGRKPIVELISEQPVLFLASQKGVFALSQSGQVLAKSSDLPGIKDMILPTVRDEANLPIEVGKGALSSQDVAFITSLVKQFDDKKLVLESLILPPLASELQVRIVGNTYSIKFSLLTDPRIAAGQYLSVRKKLEADNINPAEYIDVRVEEKVYIK